MKKLLLLTFVALLCANSFGQIQHPYVKNQLILKFKDNKLQSSLEARKIENAKMLGLLNAEKDLASYRLTGDRKTISTYALTYETDQDIHGLIEEFMATGMFDYVEPNYIGELQVDRVVPNDERYFKQWNYDNDGTFISSDSKIDADVDMDLAWDVEQGSTSITVCIIDTGCKLDHPEFAGRNWINSSESLDGMGLNNKE